MRRLKQFVLKRPVCDGLEAGHPWVFRDKVGEEARDLRDGDWLQLMDSSGGVIGTGLWQAEGGVAIRVLRLGHRTVTIGWLRQQLDVALARRAHLHKETDAYRVLNGESDGFPGVVIDIYAGVAVLQTYVPGVDALGRYLAGLVSQRLDLSAVIWKAPSKRVGGRDFSNRLLSGARPYVVKFHEGELELAADLFSGQKSGTYLDLRGLRRYLMTQNLTGKKVLNLFSYTGMAGLACAHAGAREVINVDAAQASLDFGRRYHKHPAQKWECADIFEWVNGLQSRSFDLIVVDPPSMASNKTQVIKALKTYHRLYSTLLGKLKPGGTVVACCCTSRISPREFEDKVSFALRPLSRKFALPMEIDHQPAFAEADYLKILVFRQDEAQASARPGSRATSSAGKAKDTASRAGTSKSAPKQTSKAGPHAKDKSAPRPKGKSGPRPAPKSTPKGPFKSGSKGAGPTGGARTPKPPRR